MIHLEYVDRAASVQTVPVVCMHCEQPTCAEVCPADAIKRTGDGIVQSARKPRCIACGNCVVACPFGVPELYEDRQIMMKCDMCYDRSSVGKKPMCATVCPSQALFFGTREQIEQLRPLLPRLDVVFGHMRLRTAARETDVFPGALGRSAPETVFTETPALSAMSDNDAVNPLPPMGYRLPINPFVEPLSRRGLAAHRVRVAH